MMLKNGTVDETFLDELMAKVRSRSASDLHLVPGCRPMQRIDGQLIEAGSFFITGDMTERWVKQMLSDEQLGVLQKNKEIDFAGEGIVSGRSRINVFFAGGKYAVAIRLLSREVPTCEDLNLPKAVRSLAELRQGLVLVTGATGSGKSTTIAALLNKINHETGSRIITLEDPIEFVHTSAKSVISQREVGRDTLSFARGLRSALREDPDVIMVGELRDYETAAAALTAAETGHLVLTTLHTADVTTTINRLVELRQEYRQQTRMQLAENLQGVICQQLLRRCSGGRIAAFEILAATEAIRSVIREGKDHLLSSYIQTGSRYGMITMEQYTDELRRQGMLE